MKGANILCAIQLLISWHKLLNVLWPEAKIGYWTRYRQKVFYYDIDMEHTLTPEDLGKIEKEMSRIVKEKFTDY